MAVLGLELYNPDEPEGPDVDVDPQVADELVLTDEEMVDAEIESDIVQDFEAVEVGH